jgi:hypothetical protein
MKKSIIAGLALCAALTALGGRKGPAYVIPGASGG